MALSGPMNASVAFDLGKDTSMRTQSRTRLTASASVLALALALGIGASTAMADCRHALLISQLPGHAAKHHQVERMD